MATTAKTKQDERTKKQEKATAKTPGLAQMEMAERWDTITDLLGGTAVIRALGEKYLPKEPREDAKDYQLRVSRTFLYEALGDTIDKVSAKPFEQPVTIENEELPEQLRGIETNVDLSGTSLNSMSKAAFKNAATRGMTHVLVDVPENEERSASTTVRPFFVHIKAEDIIAAKEEYDVALGLRVLSSLRYRFSVTERIAGNEFGEAENRYIKEWTRTHWRTFAPNDDKEMIPGPWKAHSFRSAHGGGIPLVTGYLEKDGEFKAKPPFRKLADLNVEHLQKCSDHTNLGRFAAVGVLGLFGFETEDKEGHRVDFTWGPRNTLMSANPDARAEIIEHSGSALGTLSDGILRIEERMEVMGLEPFMRKTGAETATGKALHVGKSDSAIRDWVREIEGLLLDAYKMAGEWLSKSSGSVSDVVVPDDWKVSFFTDFKAPVLKGSDDVDQLLKVYGQQLISQETALKELKRRGTLGEDLDIQEEIERVAEEVPPMPPSAPNQFGKEGDGGDEPPETSEEELEGTA